MPGMKNGMAKKKAKPVKKMRGGGMTAKKMRGGGMAMKDKPPGMKEGGEAMMDLPPKAKALPKKMRGGGDVGSGSRVRSSSSKPL